MQKKNLRTGRHNNRNYSKLSIQKKSLKTGKSVHALLDNIKQPNIHNWSPWKRGWRTENLLEKVMAKIFLNLMKTVNSQIQEAQWAPCTRNTKENYTNACMTQMLKTCDKEDIFEAVGGKNIYIERETNIRIAADFSLETLQVRRW